MYVQSLTKLNTFWSINVSPTNRQTTAPTVSAVYPYDVGFIAVVLSSIIEATPECCPTSLKWDSLPSM